MVAVIAILGLVMGSFAGAQVWRLRAWQLLTDKQSGEKLTKLEQAELVRLRPLTSKPLADDRSRCLHCKHELAVRDLVPLISWLSTGGRCRYCKKPIGWFEPLIELSVATLFTVSFILWPFPIADFVSISIFLLWLTSLILFVILFAYDAKWFLLPDIIIWPLLAIGSIFAVIRLMNAPDLVGALTSLLIGLVILSGLYAALYYYSSWRSKGESSWVGFGDVKLGFVLALFLLDWQLAFLTLFVANFLGSCIAIPGLLLKILPRGARIPFGPLLLAGFFISMFWGQYIIDWFNKLML
ncbi:prepilin peptidase [Candidatus Saccharibacteria bacterium]|nr:prepilin peptidase [Candidatus Saccharibacteria bacterium]